MQFFLKERTSLLDLWLQQEDLDLITDVGCQEKHKNEKKWRFWKRGWHLCFMKSVACRVKAVLRAGLMAPAHSFKRGCYSDRNGNVLYRYFWHILSKQVSLPSVQHLVIAWANIKGKCLVPALGTGRHQKSKDTTWLETNTGDAGACRAQTRCLPILPETRIRTWQKPRFCQSQDWCSLLLT